MPTSAKQASSIPAKNASRERQPMIISQKANQPKLNATFNRRVTFTSSTKENGKEAPLYMALDDITVTPTGFSDMKEKGAICRKIELMLGEVSNDFTSQTTHILAAHACATEVRMGQERNVTIVTSEWIESLWDACQLENNNPYIHASHCKYRDFKFPIFYNLRFMFSGLLDKETTTYCEKLVREHGGSISEKISDPSASFYICQQPEKKLHYRYAEANDVACITSAWIHDSVRTNITARVSDYDVRHR